MEKLSKDLERRIISLRGKHFSLNEILRVTGAKDPVAVQEVLDRDKEDVIETFSKVSKESPQYRDILVNAVRLLRTEYNLNYRQIAKALKESEYLIFDIIRRNAVSLGASGYVKSSFTREEKRMRNEDMIKLNKKGKTLAEIGKIYFCSKQIVSRIFQDIEYKPISEKEVLSNGIELDKPADVLTLESQVRELKDTITHVRRQASIAKYHLSQQILDLRLGYIQALMQNIEMGKPSEETIRQYKALRLMLKRTLNALNKVGSEDTLEVNKINAVMPLIAVADRKVK